MVYVVLEVLVYKEVLVYEEVTHDGVTLQSVWTLTLVLRTLIGSDGMLHSICSSSDIL